MSRDEEFTAFVVGRYASLVRTAFLLVGDRGYAEDLVQSALVKTYTAWPRLREPDHVQAYTRKVLVRASSRWRARRWHGETPTAQLPNGPDGLGVGEPTDVRRALALLPAGQRAVLVLRFLDDLSEGQTAELLGVSVGTVKSRTSRGLAALRLSPALLEEVPRD